MKLTVHGAARTTTGSLYVLEVNGRRVAFECGFFQGRRKESIERNRNFKFAPSTVDALLLSHAHIDHCGNVPNFVKRGFSGPIYSSHGTRDLATLLLEDSAHIQEADCAFINKRNAKQGKKEPPAEPLYSVAEARAAIQQLVSVANGRALEVIPGVTVTFVEAGHILGSTQILFDIEEGGRQLRLAFTGDLGRGNNPIHPNPHPLRDVDILLTESTYGGRTHGPIEQANARLASIIKDTLQRRGKIIIPAFSVDRTQQILYSLHQLTQAKVLPDLPVYVDSPLSVNATEIFLLHPECFNESINQMFRRYENPFGLRGLTFIRTGEESKRLNSRQDPCIIISASGMCEAGRIRHHLRNNIGCDRNTILMVGFCAPNTLGAAIAAGQKEVSIFAEKCEVKARVELMDAYSAHADSSELMAHVRNCTGPLRQILVTHGQYEQSSALMKSLQKERPDAKVYIPDLHEEIELA